jgi:hypothetical protein
LNWAICTCSDLEVIGSRIEVIGNTVEVGTDVKMLVKAAISITNSHIQVTGQKIHHMSMRFTNCRNFAIGFL